MPPILEALALLPSPSTPLNTEKKMRGPITILRIAKNAVFNSSEIDCNVPDDSKIIPVAQPRRAETMSATRKKFLFIFSAESLCPKKIEC